MIPKSPLMYLTLPLALALGLIWFRRKKVHCDTGGGKKKPVNDSAQAIANESDLNKIFLQQQQRQANGKRHDFKHSLSVPIGKSTSSPTALNKQQHTSPLNNNDSFDLKFGKSAPIDITPNKTSPSRNQKLNDKQAAIDAEELKSKIQDAELKTLNSIEEHSFESVDLPGSIGCRRRFSFTIKSQEPAIVIKASNMADSKSPQSSFEDVPVTSADDGKKLKKQIKPEKTEKLVTKVNVTKTEQKKKIDQKESRTILTTITTI